MENNELSSRKNKDSDRKEFLRFRDCLRYLKRKGYTVESFIADYQERKAGIDEVERLEQQLSELKERFNL